MKIIGDLPLLPLWVDSLFIVTTIVTIGFFYYSNGKPRVITLLIIAWSIVQSTLAYIGFYQVMDTMPPRFGLVLIPVIIILILAFRRKEIAWIHRNRNTNISTFLHTIRIPVEIVLFCLFMNGMVPELMTFEGRNFDIIAGITAPIVGFLFYQKRLSKRLLIVWNIGALGMVLFILINGLLSAELPFQQFGFDQPNRAVTFFPYILLPATIVPIVIYTHISDIIKLRRKLT